MSLRAPPPLVGVVIAAAVAAATAARQPDGPGALEADVKGAQVAPEQVVPRVRDVSLALRAGERGRLVGARPDQQ